MSNSQFTTTDDIPQEAKDLIAKILQLIERMMKTEIARLDMEDTPLARAIVLNKILKVLREDLPSMLTESESIVLRLNVIENLINMMIIDELHKELATWEAALLR